MKTLVEKTTAAAQCLFTDCEPVLDLRLHLEVPVICLPPTNSEQGAASLLGPLRCHPHFPDDVAAVRELLDGLDGSLDLTEPFVRIREAMSEARKLGAVSRN